jgi:hypothetical protein
MDTPDRPLTPPNTASDRPVLSAFQKSLSKIVQHENISDLVGVAEQEELAVGFTMPMKNCTMLTIAVRQGDAKDLEDANRLFIVAPLVLGYLILDYL